MPKIWCYFLFLAWLSYLMIAGLMVFSSGFLLERVHFTEKSQCLSCDNNSNCNMEKPLLNLKDAAQFCQEPRARVVVLLVDALKFEFVNWYPGNYTSSYHRNKLPIIHNLMKKHPDYTRLYRFIADPPTTTMQRLKSLTTGTLPTFIEIGSNFAADVVEEDNWVDQAEKKGAVFMGDDTWTGLYPNKFLRQYPAPSFNVWDLDSVDWEVRNRIFGELKKNDWSVIIAHILGVDHCGHKHGMHHPEMTRKLNDTNELIKDIVDSLEDDVILMIVGDHGMTESGDHGGETIDEVEAAMFIYSKIPLIPSSLSDGNGLVSQIDFVPTISSILGNPIPFSSIGFIIPDALPTWNKNNVSFVDTNKLLVSIWKNIAQTKLYIDTYAASAFLFAKENIEMLHAMYDNLAVEVAHINDEDDLKNFIIHARDYSRTLRNMCAEIWIQFDSGLMCKGLVLMFCALFSFYMIFNGISESRLIKIFDSSFMKFSTWCNVFAASTVFFLFCVGIVHDIKDTMFFVTGITSVSLLGILLVQNWDIVSSTWYNASRYNQIDYLSRLTFLLTLIGLFSNSYIVEEDKVISFLLITIFCVSMYNIDKSEKPSDNNEKKSKFFPKPASRTSFRVILALIWILACLGIRFSNYFWRCREEQDRNTCSSFVMGKIGSITSKNFGQATLFASLVTLALFITIVRLWLQNCGNLSGFSPSVMIARYCPAVLVVFMGCYWILKLSKDTKIKYVISWQVNALPRMIYSLILMAIAMLYYRPLCVYLLPNWREPINCDEENLIPKLYERVKNTIYRKKSENSQHEQIPVVYGLGTVYSSPFVQLAVFLTLLHALLLGHVLAPSTIVMFIIGVSILIVSTIERFQKANSFDDLLKIPSSVLLCWFLLAEYFFYATGHQATFDTIHWDSAFIGIDEHFQSKFVQAILIGVNTFGSYILFGATLPLLIIVPFALHLMFPNLAKARFRKDLEMSKGELILFDKNVHFHTATFSLAGKYLLFHGVRVFASMLAATIHCRHLMVWKIFTPKLIFEGLSLLVTIFSVLASYFLLIRINSQVDQLVTRVSKT